MVKFLRTFHGLLLLSCSYCADLERPAKPDAPAHGVILIVGSDFSTAFLSVLEVSSLRVVRDIVPLHNDSILRYHAAEDASYAVQRLGSDSLRKLSNTYAYNTLYEKSLGTGKNPQDVAFLPGNRLAVSLYNSNRILIIDQQTGLQVAEAELSQFRDSDGYAEIAALLYANAALYVAVQRLNRNATDAVWPPVGDSYLLKIDPNSYAIVKATQLSHSNPVSRLHYNAARNSLLFAAPARYYANASLDGACLEYSLTTDTLLTPPITEAQAGLEIADCQIRSDGSGVLLGNDLSLNSVLALFNPATHQLIRVASQLSSSNGGYFSDFLLHSNGKLYLADRNIYSPGIRIFSGSNLTEETQQAIYTGLPPFVLEEVP
jgi:hypothetical protein